MLRYPFHAPRDIIWIQPVRHIMIQSIKVSFEITGPIRLYYLTEGILYLQCDGNSHENSWVLVRKDESGIPYNFQHCGVYNYLFFLFYIKGTTF